MKKLVNAYNESKIPYTLVSMAAILRDYYDPNYLNDEHYKLTSIADYLYNSADGAFSDHPEDNLLPEFKVLFDKYGKAYFDKVLDDMYALDGQLTSDAKVQELIQDYEDRLSSVTASTKVTAATNYDTKLIAKWLKAKFDDEAFGTAYTMHRISDADAYMSRNGLTYNRRNNTIDLWKSGGDEDIPVYKVIPQYSSTKRQGTYAPKMPKLVPIDEWNATHGVTASTRVMASRWYYYEPMSEQELADLEADILALPGCDKLDMDTDGMEEMGHICILPGYNDISLSDPQWYEKRKQLLKDIIRVAKEHGLSRTEDPIEDYGSCWYIVLRTNKPKTGEYEEYDDVTTSTKVTATEDNSYNQHLVQVSKEDKQYVLNDLNKSHKTVGMGGAGDPGYYVSEFEPAYGLYLWASDTGLRILDDNGIEYTEVKKAVGASTKVSASDNPFYDKLSDYDKRIVDNQRKQFSPLTFDVYNALLPYIGEYSSNTGWTGSCDLMKVKDNNTVDGYLYKVIWDDGHDIDTFSWQVNDNPRVGGDFTLMLMPAHGMPVFCDSEKDFYRAVRKVFGDGLKKIN